MPLLTLLHEFIRLSVNEAKEGVYIDDPSSELVEPAPHLIGFKEMLEDVLPPGRYAVGLKFTPQAERNRLRSQGKTAKSYVLYVKAITEPGFAFDEGFVEKYALQSRLPEISALQRAICSNVMKRLKKAELHQDVEIQCRIDDRAVLTKMFIADRDYLGLKGEGGLEDGRTNGDTAIDQIPGMTDTTSWRQKKNGTKQWKHEPTGITFTGTTYPTSAGMPGVFKYFKDVARATPLGTNVTPEQAAKLVTKRLDNVAKKTLA